MRQFYKDGSQFLGVLLRVARWTRRRLVPKLPRLLVAGACLMLPTASIADTTYYGYDARGRLNNAFRVEGILEGRRDVYLHDGSGNRWITASEPSVLILRANDYRMSLDGRFKLIMQTDGNLVLYFGATALWASNTFGAGNEAVLLNDGHLVVFSAGWTSVLWSSGTWGNPGAYIGLENDGNFIIYGLGHVPLWTSNTGGH